MSITQYLILAQANMALIVFALMVVISLAILLATLVKRVLARRPREGGGDTRQTPRRRFAQGRTPGNNLLNAVANFIAEWLARGSSSFTSNAQRQPAFNPAYAVQGDDEDLPVAEAVLSEVVILSEGSQNTNTSGMAVSSAPLAPPGYLDNR